MFVPAVAVLFSLGGAAWAQSQAAGPVSDGVQIQTAENLQETVLFYAFAAATVISALGVVLSGNVVRMAMCLFATFGAVAVLFFLLQAFFLGVVQLIVYVGGILVLIVFGIMLTSSSPWLKFDIKRRELFATGAICAGLAALLCHGVYHATWKGRALEQGPTMSALGKSLLTDYLVPFEVASVLLLVVMIGAAYLAKQERR